MPTPLVELDHEDLLPLCMLSVTHSSSAEIERKEIQLPGLGSCKVSITIVLVSSFVQKKTIYHVFPSLEGHVPTCVSVE